VKRPFDLRPDGECRSAFVDKLAIDVVALLAAVPLTIWGVQFARRHRRTAHAAATLLLLFGLNMQVDPPPPPRTEAVERDEEAAKDDEPE
jgi:hypothetical protein